jgi:hypothetical protein
MISKLLIICWICCNKLKELIYSYRAWQDKEAFSLCYAKIPSGAFKILSKNRWNDNGKKTVWSLDHCFCVLWALGSGEILQFFNFESSAVVSDEQCTATDMHLMICIGRFPVFYLSSAGDVFFECYFVYAWRTIFFCAVWCISEMMYFRGREDFRWVLDSIRSNERWELLDL